ncbi:glutathione S-transferase [Favolaschia claudopus]|uniref:glutathione transferase n=1 Tax=Favolaschia claudopus TaxID=2862362 RepID=A0AAW0EI78_9AGAR
MAILKLYGYYKSTCTWRVATVLYEAKVPFQFIPVDVLNGEHKTPGFLDKQPFGQIPYIDDDGFILYESRAICRYIAAKHPESKLVPTDPKRHALFEQAAASECFNFEGQAGPIILEIWGKALSGLKGDEDVVSARTAALDAKLDGYNAILSKQRYIAGDELTLVDLYHLPHAPIIQAKTGVMTRKSHVARWYTDLASRPSWRAFEDGVKSMLEY